MAGNRIKQLRKEAGYSQKALGEALNVGQTTVSAWEIGRNEPDNAAAHKMGQLFGCSIGYLMGYEGESKTRGLTEEEWKAFVWRKHREAEYEVFMRKIEERDEAEAEIEGYLQQQREHDEEKAWEDNNRIIFPESRAIDFILERTDQAGRQRALQVIELMFPRNTGDQ